MFLLPGIDSTDALVAAIGLVLSAVGLSTAAGLRAYVPVLAVALGSNIPAPHGGHLVSLTPPFHFLGAVQFIVLLAALGLVEFVVDKIPLLVHVSDLFHTVIRPAAGAIVMAGTMNALSERSVWLAGLVGAFLALTVHTAKAASRPGISAATAGLGNPVVSLGEDAVTILLAVLALVAPYVALLLLLALVAVVGPLVVRGLRWSWKTSRSNARSAARGQHTSSRSRSSGTDARRPCSSGGSDRAS
jgi:hypothetical protein